MDILVADGSVGEFGWELMSWQAHVRRKALDYDGVIVCTTRGHEALYDDFANKFIVHSVPMLRDCFEQRDIYDALAWQQYRAKIARKIEQLRAEGHEVTVITAKNYIPIEVQNFIQYGNAAAAVKRGEAYDIVLHARNKESNNPYYRIYNWPVESWNEVVAHLHSVGLTVAAVGTTDDAFLPEGAVDLRNMSMHRLMDTMAAAKLVIGPSSGPMHLASLCHTPHLVWTGKQWSSTIKSYNAERYEWKWNPLRTTCRVITKDDPNLGAPEVIIELERMLIQLAGDDKPSDIPGAAVANTMISYWRDRVAREGRDYVSRMTKNTAEQKEFIDDRLYSLFDGGHYNHGLDFGCGWGRFTDVVAEHCDKVTAVDLVDSFRDDLPDHVHFQQIGFPTKINIPDNSVDLLLAMLVLQHVVDDNWLENIAAELRRVLAESALVVIIDDNGRPAGHVKQRPAIEFKRLLGLGWYEAKRFDLDSPSSHHIIIGSHVES